MVNEVHSKHHELNTYHREDAFGQKKVLISQRLKVGFDPLELAKEISEVKEETEVIPIQEKVDKNTEVIAKLYEFKQLMADLQSSCQGLTNYMGADTTVANAWKNKTATIIDSIGADRSSAVKITAQKAANLKEFTFEVVQLASMDKITSTATLGVNDSTALNITGNLVVNGTSLVITADMTLDGIKDLINNSTSETKVYAETINYNIVNGDYRLNLCANQLASPIDLTGTDLAVLTALQIPLDLIDPTKAAQTSLSSLQAQVKYNGSSVITRNANVISDIIPNVNIEIYQQGTGVLKATIDTDRQNIVDQVAGFIKKIDSETTFFKEQTKEADKLMHTPDEKAILFNNKLLKDFQKELKRIMISPVPGLTGDGAKTLGDLGLSVGKSSNSTSGSFLENNDTSGKIYPDVTKLESFIFGSDLTQIQSVLGDIGVSTSTYFTIGSIPQLSKDGTLAGKAITVNLVNEDGTINAYLSADGVTTVQATYANNVITAPNDSPFSGLILGYDGPALSNPGNSQTTTVTCTQGVMSRIAYIANNYLTNQSGLIDTEVKRLSDLNTTYSSRIDINKNRIKKEEASLINSFGRIREMESYYNNLADNVKAALNPKRDD